jgi:hypothetical protein
MQNEDLKWSESRLLEIDFKGTIIRFFMSKLTVPQH